MRSWLQVGRCPWVQGHGSVWAATGSSRSGFVSFAALVTDAEIVVQKHSISVAVQAMRQDRAPAGALKIYALKVARIGATVRVTVAQ